ncbi:hypothetical protein ILUMI_15619 [Ignelater luminosus]|uniref:RNA-directed DNA polymerase n=1 Tax=Ignelater luminosus TaxID=2038154 RepID=A0A8K0CQ44_IGNLU|nr:hypothetical protein ILUMI_15619 [Ignelater luminosus]
MEDNNIIKKVDGSTPWVNSIVIVRIPNGSLRICLDPRDLNKVIQREYFKLPSLEEITYKLSGAKYFTTLDAINGRTEEVCPNIKGALDIELHYVPGKYLYLADTLSRATSTNNKITKSEDKFDEEVEAHVGLLQMHLNATDHKVMEIQKATSEDAVYLLSKFHYGHFGVNKTKNRARLCFYWPGMATDIEKMVLSCHICMTHRKNNSREPLIPHDIPNRPWQKVACDLFNIGRDAYLLVVDYYSKYIEIAKLEDLKSIYARHGIPYVVMSDNGLQFTSRLFKRFSQEWEYQHITSSLLYSQSNGVVEQNVRIVKNSLIKAKQANRDMYLVLLHYRNSPIKRINLSPAQLLMAKTLRDTLPINESLLIPRTSNKNLVKGALRKRQESQRYYYNTGTKPLNPIKHRQKIYVKTQLKDKEWRQSTIENRKEQPRSYTFKNSEGNSYPRNRRLINVIPDIPDDEVRQEELSKASQSVREDDNETILNVNYFETFNVPTQSNRGRPIKIPDRLKY